MTLEDELSGQKRIVFGTPLEKIFCRACGKPAHQYLVDSIISPEEDPDTKVVVGWMVWALCADCAEIESAQLRFERDLTGNEK